MLRDPPKHHHMNAPIDSAFVPEMFLSSHVHQQLLNLHLCDTLTVDPHKSGFCPYPAGALCYRDKRMNSFLGISDNVNYYHGHTILGNVGIEGSKPGAAAAAVMLANRVRPQTQTKARSRSRLRSRSRSRSQSRSRSR